ncbi:MFS transporter [Rhodovulum sp. DZ06]|uniref:MFS transporter n=1 Tax=Rhodovulum sp. DZ06 TaxID=3425126 RepID=UPI003D3434BE
MSTPPVAGTVVPGARARFGWMMFDWASQPCHTLLWTFIFAPYFTSSVAPDPVTGQEMWGWGTAVAGLAVAVMSPFLGALADATGPRKPWALLFSIAYVVGAAMLWTAVPGDPDPVMALFWFGLALLGVEFATVFTNAMLPDLAPPDRVGRLSGSGWALGYVGGLVSLAFTLLLLAESAETGLTLLGIPPLFGLDPELREGTRAVGPFSALWYLVFIPPLFLWVPDAQKRGAWKGAMARGLGQLWASIKDVKNRDGLGWFLGASMLYRDALNGFYAFGGIYAAGVLGWSITQIGVFGVVAALLGAIGAWIGGMADARFGPRRVVGFTLGGLILAAVIGVSVRPGMILYVVEVPMDSGLPDIIFYCVGGMIGAFGGTLQAASRTLVTRFADEGRMTSAFGLYALAGKATAFLAPMLIAVATGLTGDQQLGILPVVGLFVLGYALLAKAGSPPARG